MVAGLTSVLGITDLGGAVQMSLALWIGFPVMLLIGSGIWEKVPPMLAAIHAGHWPHGRAFLSDSHHQRLSFGSAPNRRLAT